MMQPSPAEFNIDKWIEKAEEDELRCRSLLKHRDAPPSAPCFLAQQMAEKYLKALLILQSKNYPKIHDLKRLATLIELSVPDIFDLEDQFNVLNKFYATTRYPGDFPEGFSWRDAEEAFAAALRIKEFVMRKIQPLKTSGGFGLIGIIIALAVVIFAGSGGLYWKEMRNQKSVLQSGNDAVKQAEKLKENIEGQNEAVADETVGSKSTGGVKQTMQTQVRTASSTESVDTSNWKMYRNEKYGFEVKYPENIVLKKDIERECAVGMGPAKFKITTLNAGVPLPVIFRSHIEEEVLFAGSIQHQSSECLNIQLPLVSFHIISKPKNFTDLETYVNNEKISAETLESKWPSAAGQSFGVQYEMIGNAKAFVLTSSDFSAHKNIGEAIYLERGENIYYMGFNYSAIDAGLSGDKRSIDDNSVLIYQVVRKIIKTFKFLK